jgi:hypothetical protein
MEIFLIANSVEPVQGRIHINEPSLFRDGGNPTEYGVRLNSRSSAARSRWTFVTLMAGAELFA